MGNLEMLEPRLANDGQSGVLLQEAMEAAELGAQLTERMLAFARRQPLEPKVMDINELVHDMTDMLRRSLGESIEISTVLADDLRQAKADPTQLQNALLNLCINARDAMPDGGKFKQPTPKGHEIIPAGKDVSISVSDTCTGITKENLDRIFEPFFSTKEVGDGTALGLSTVYGILHQTYGCKLVESSMVEVTSFILYLSVYHVLPAAVA